MNTTPRRERVTIDRTFVGYGMCGPQYTLHLKRDRFETSLTVFWGTQNVDSTATVVSEIAAVVGVKSWEKLRGKEVDALLYPSESDSRVYVCDAIEDVTGSRRFSVREHFEKTWRLPCHVEYSYDLGIRDALKNDWRTVNAKIAKTFLGKDGNDFRVGLKLCNPHEKVDGWFNLPFDEQDDLARGMRVDSAIASLRSTVRAEAWENLHGQIVRAIIDGKGDIIGVANLMEPTFFTKFDFWWDSQIRQLPPDED